MSEKKKQMQIDGSRVINIDDELSQPEREAKKRVWLDAYNAWDKSVRYREAPFTYGFNAGYIAGREAMAKELAAEEGGDE